MIEAVRLSALFDAHAAQLVLYARQWLDRQAAEDVVQEAYVRLMLQIAEPHNAKAWLFTTVRNEAISQVRSALRRRQREQDVTRPDWFVPGSEMLDARAAQDAMQSLPQPQREAIVLRIWGQLTLREIGSIMGCSISGVFEHYRAGLAALREQMGVTCHSESQ